MDAETARLILAITGGITSCCLATLCFQMREIIKIIKNRRRR